MKPRGVLRDIASKIPVHPSAGKRRIWIALLVVGAVAFGYLLFHESAARLGRVGRSNTIYFLGIAEGAIAFAAAIRLSNGRWAGRCSGSRSRSRRTCPPASPPWPCCCSWASGSTCRGRATSSRGRRRS